MSTSQAASLNVVPFLARIVLAAAFIPAGWNKLMSETTFEGEDAALLRSIGAAGGGASSPTPSGGGAQGDEGKKTSALFGPGATGGWSMLAAAPPAAPPAGPAAVPPATPPTKPPTNPPGGQSTPPSKAPPAAAPKTPPAEKAPPKAAPAGPPAAAPADRPVGIPAGSGAPAEPTGIPAPPAGAATDPPAGDAPAGAGTGAPIGAPIGAPTGAEAASPPLGDPSPLKAASLHHVTLMVHRHGMAYPVYQAYLATAVELLGGSLILLGLFSRLWGLGLAGVMAVAFWFTSWPLLAAGNPIGTLFSLPIPDFNRMFCQAALFVLAFGVFLTGPGALSLDRAIFRRAPAE